MKLRVCDAGTVGAWRSQALWHGIASAMQPDAPSVLSLCRPGEPYVGIGYHRSLDEIDLVRCSELGLPVIRRQIGGGPVYLDSDQLFFQITMPAHRAPPMVARLYERCLRPVVVALGRLGLTGAGLNGVNDIAVGRRKISGTGAGHIGEAVTVVGNILFRFSHQRMTDVLAVPSEPMRRECLRVMRRHVTSLEREGLGAVSFSAARNALIAAFADQFDVTLAPECLNDAEEQATAAWERRFVDRQWLNGPEQPRRGDCRIKISTDAWMWAAADDRLAIEATVVAGCLQHVRVAAPGLNGAAGSIQRALVGAPCRSGPIRGRLEPFGEPGRRAIALLESGLLCRRNG